MNTTERSEVPESTGTAIKRRIYLASSWRNEMQPVVLDQLRQAGHEVYDFRNPGPGDQGFGWRSIDPDWKSWTPEQFKSALQHPIAIAGHKLDHDAMEWCDACVLLLPSGSSAHLEAGWCAGRGKITCVYAPAMREPELMYRSLARRGRGCVDLSELAFSPIETWGPIDRSDLGVFFTTMLDVTSFLGRFHASR